QLTAALDVDVSRAIDEDIADAVIAEQRLDRPESGDLVDDLLDDLLALVRAQRRLLGADELDHRIADLRREQCFVSDALERREIEALDELAVELQLQLIDGA